MFFSLQVPHLSVIDKLSRKKRFFAKWMECHFCLIIRTGEIPFVSKLFKVSRTFTVLNEGFKLRFSCFSIENCLKKEIFKLSFAEKKFILYIIFSIHQKRDYFGHIQTLLSLFNGFYCIYFYFLKGICVQYNILYSWVTLKQYKSFADFIQTKLYIFVKTSIKNKFNYL